LLFRPTYERKKNHPLRTYDYTKKASKLRFARSVLGLSFLATPKGYSLEPGLSTTTHLQQQSSYIFKTPKNNTTRSCGKEEADVQPNSQKHSTHSCYQTDRPFFRPTAAAAIPTH